MGRQEQDKVKLWEEEETPDGDGGKSIMKERTTVRQKQQ